MGRTVLVAGLGIVADTVRYTWEDPPPCEGRYPAEALVRMGLVEPDSVLVVTTGTAWEKHGKDLEERLAGAGVGEVEVVLVSPGQGPADLARVYREVRAALEDHAGGASVVLDLASGMRHVSLLVYWAAMVLDAEGRLSLDGAWYAGITTGETGHSEDAGKDREPRAEGGKVGQITDLSGLLFLANWQAGWRTFRELGTLRPLLEVLGGRRRLAFAGASEKGGQLAKLHALLRSLSGALEQGWPLDVGRAAREVIDASAAMQLEDDDAGGYFAPGVGRILDVVDEMIAQFAVPRGRRAIDRSADDRVVPELEMAELERELQLAEWYVDHSQPWNALIVLREWMINAVILASSSGVRPPAWWGGRGCGEIRSEWLNYGKSRKVVEHRWSCLKERSRSTDPQLPLPEDVGTLVKLWQKISGYRNQVAHGAFTMDPVREAEDLSLSLRSIVSRLKQWKDLVERGEDSPWRLELTADQGRVVLMPVGTAAGVVTTIVRREHPDYLVLVCSAESRAGAEALLERLEFPCERVTWIAVENPFRCHEKRSVHLAWEEVGRVLGDAGELLAVLTGGTSSMVVLVDRLRRKAEKRGVVTRKCILIEGRSPEEQRADPFAGGEVVFLDEGTADGKGEGNEDDPSA